MPLYSFKSKDGKKVDEFFPMFEIPEFVSIDGEKFFRDMESEWSSGPKSGSKGEWPIECYAVGVHASQAQELRDYFKSHGCPTEVTKDGDPVFRDHQHMKRALKCRGQHHNNSYGN